jgi:hypothetical protein
VVSDSKIPVGNVVVTTANYNYIGTFDDPTKETFPFRNIKNVVRRTNFLLERTQPKSKENITIPVVLLIS